MNKIMMIKNIINPTCNRTFQKWLLLNKNYQYIYNSIRNPRPHDVTLNVGIKKLPKEERDQFKESDTMLVYKEIVDKYCPETIDISYNGNNINVFEEVNILYDDAQMYLKNTNNEKLITNFAYMPLDDDHPSYTTNLGCNISFKTSFSNSFQKISTGLTTLDTLEIIKNIIKKTDNNVHNIPVIQSNKYKLYYSCFDCCPVEQNGFFSSEYIANTIVCNKNYLNKLSHISLVDTMGTLYFKSLFEVIERITYANSNGNHNLSVNNIALQLTYRPGEEHKLYKKFEESLKCKVNKFEVSMFKNNTCGNLLVNNQIVPGNMTYDMYYDFLTYYIVSQLE